MSSQLAAARSRRSKPFKQGLDALCGVYSVVNGIGCCVGPGVLRKKDYERLFERAIVSLRRQGVLRNALTNGMNTLTLIQVLRDVAKDLGRLNLSIVVKRPFAKQSSISNARFARVLGTHLGSDGAAVIMSFDGPDFGHWTVIRGTTADGLLLSDSGTMSRMPWRSLTLDERQRDFHRYLIDIRSVLFLQKV